MERDLKPKTVDFSLTEQVHIVYPEDLNGGRRLFGGTLLQWMDVLAGIVARRHSQCINVTTACIDNLTFKAGAYENDMIVLIGYVTYTGNTSMEIRIDTYCEDLYGMRRPINRAYFVMVGMDENDKPTKIPPLVIQTEAEKAKWEGALKRKENRLARKKEGF